MVGDEHVPIRTCIEVLESRAGDLHSAQTRGHGYDEPPSESDEEGPNAGFVEKSERPGAQVGNDERSVERAAQTKSVQDAFGDARGGVVCSGRQSSATVQADMRYVNRSRNGMTILRSRNLIRACAGSLRIVWRARAPGIRPTNPVEGMRRE